MVKENYDNNQNDSKFYSSCSNDIGKYCLPRGTKKEDIWN